jgi:Ca-activated chloride channel family protein
VSGGTGAGLDFTIEVDATSDLAVDTDRLEALITIEATSGATPAPTSQIAEVLIMDRSLSMQRQNKIHEARRAACAAIDALPGGALLGIVAGNRQATLLFPPSGGLAAINTRTRTAAKNKVMSLWPEGGTKIGQWLTAANDLFAAEPTAGIIRHAVLYTDGKNEHESRPELDAALTACADRFICDVRGLGDDWDYTELLHLAGALHGDAKAVLRIADLTDDFTRLMRRVRRLVVPRTYLRLSPNNRFQIAAVAQTYPVQVELTQQQRPAGATAVDVPLGSWEEHATRRYQVSLRFNPDTIPTGEKLRAARVDLLTELTDGTLKPCAHAPLTIFRHITPGFATVVPPSLTRAGNERELGLAMRACADAWRQRRPAEAEEELNLAFRLARELDDVRLPVLQSVSVIGPDGRARLRTDVTTGEMQKLGLDSTMTARPTPEPRPAPQPDAAGVARRHQPQPAARRHAKADMPQSEASGPTAGVCDVCGEPNQEDAAYCVECGEPLHGGGGS